MQNTDTLAIILSYSENILVITGKTKALPEYFSF